VCPAEQHRELVRQCLRTLLASGYSPLAYFTKDFHKYFYLAELLSLVDLSLVRPITFEHTPGAGGRHLFWVALSLSET